MYVDVEWFCMSDYEWFASGVLGVGVAPGRVVDTDVSGWKSDGKVLGVLG